MSETALVVVDDSAPSEPLRGLVGDHSEARIIDLENAATRREDRIAVLEGKVDKLERAVRILCAGERAGACAEEALEE